MMANRFVAEEADAKAEAMEEADALIMTAEMPAEEIGDRVEAFGMAAGMLTISCDMLC